MKYFKREEFACKCGCGQDTVDYELIEVLDRLREWAGAPVTVTSGNRCPEHNKKIGGASTSQHTRGRAADIVVKGKEPFQVYRRLEEWYPYQYGIGHYDGWVHIVTRVGRARWRG